MYIYNNGSIGLGPNIFTSSVHKPSISKKVISKTTSCTKNKVSKRNLKFLEALGLKVKT